MLSIYQRSKRTKRDIIGITQRSIKDFGEQQTLEYMRGLKNAMKALADDPDKGREYIHGRTERVYLRYQYVSHVIYYRKRKNDIFITRILHVRMLPDKHL